MEALSAPAIVASALLDQAQLTGPPDPSAGGHVGKLVCEQLAVSAAVACGVRDEVPTSVLVFTGAVGVASDSTELKLSSWLAENQLGTNSITVNMLDLRLVIIQRASLTSECHFGGIGTVVHVHIEVVSDVNAIRNPKYTIGIDLQLDLEYLKIRQRFLASPVTPKISYHDHIQMPTSILITHSLELSPFESSNSNYGFHLSAPRSGPLRSLKVSYIQSQISQVSSELVATATTSSLP